MNSARTMSPFLATTKADIVANQELNMSDEQFWNAKSKFMKGCYRPGITGDPTWRAEGSPSLVTDKQGLSSGVMLYTRPAIDICPVKLPEGMEIDSTMRNPYDLIPGHLTGMIINGWVKSRFMQFSIYLDGNSKTGAKNRAILMLIGLIVAHNQLPFIITGDWNLTPEELASMGWLHTIGGYIIATDDPT